MKKRTFKDRIIWIRWEGYRLMKRKASLGTLDLLRIANRLSSQAKRKTSQGSLYLLRIAERLSLEAKKPEKPEAWRAKCQAEARLLMDQLKKEMEDGKDDPGLMLKAAQMLREAGCVDDNIAMALFYHCFLRMNFEKKTIPDHPAMKETMDRYQDIDTDTEEGKFKYGKVWVRCRFASVLRHFGEYELADLVLNDPDTANRQIKDGFLRWAEDDPNINLDTEFFETISL